VAPGITTPSRSHWYARVTGAGLHTPAAAVRVWPREGSPDSFGAPIAVSFLSAGVGVGVGLGVGVGVGVGVAVAEGVTVGVAVAVAVAETAVGTALIAAANAGAPVSANAPSATARPPARRRREVAFAITGSLRGVRGVSDCARHGTRPTCARRGNARENGVLRAR
jgi:hypothetical protein